MKKLTKREDQIMEIIWELKAASIREIVDAFPDPKPHYNTVATLVKILVKKEVLKSEMIANSYQFSPVQDFEEYRKEHLGNIKEKFFDNSLTKMMAHFAKEERLTDAEKDELIKIIKKG
ncbi:BlaI/MecI/CopY family transcriptional regulator [Sanyastnella coralliicola]|uniref:BlaI/MecI/CopY family transcriptional regulator n=1 Tax=Sanyastnella coralliicola TaxID=3069118 RepID=UPI0027B9F324|nr:BlaI/MecI/CopY family transcriptional regulator [Longitalea sp. SCSIO 12813]